MDSPYPNNTTLLTTNASNAVLGNVETSTSILPPVHATDPSMGQSHRESRMTRSQHMLSGPEIVEDFKRSRTKFTPEQLHELEALFINHGPHPTREQRALVAEKIKVPPRTVQVFLQNRRQRDTKNRNAALEAQTAKKEAQDSIAEMSATPVTFSSVPAQATPVEDSSGAESAGLLSSQSTLSMISQALEGKLSSINTPPPSSSSEPRSRDSKRSRAEIQIPTACRRISLNRVAEMMENTRRSPSSPTNNTSSKENVPVDPLFSSSPAPTELLVLTDTNTTPIKPPFNSQGSLSPTSAALWTRMISSPPTPLSPMNRRTDHLQPRPALKSVNKMGSLELACAKARIRDRRSEDKVDQTLILRSSSRASTTTSSSTTGGTPAAIANKRLREDVEKDVPRKRASISELQDLMGGPEHWNHQTHYHQHAATTATVPKHSMLRQVVAQRASSVTDSSCDTSITSDEIVTPDMSSLPPSSPQSIVCQVPFPSDSSATKELVMKSASLPVETRGDPLRGLAPLEANAAMVLASLFGGL